MIIVYPSYHVRHRPPFEVWNGTQEPHAEVPERIEVIRSSIKTIPGIREVLPRKFPRTWIEEVHDVTYIDYIAEAGRLAGDTYTYPSAFPFGVYQKTVNDIGKRGQFAFDTYTPVNNTTYQVSVGSSMAALTAASLVRRGQMAAYALCRPPGHHAERAMMGGYCYFNNAAIAAHYLSTRGRVAVLDIDVHHGNGTQNIFYARSDVLVVNIHATPESKFPYFSGNIEERGEGKGVGYTANYPLSLGTSDRAYNTVLHMALARVHDFQPSYLVVSVGYDAHEDDPIGGLQLTTGYYRRIARQIRQLNLPTVCVQEGGYNTTSLGDVAKTFVEGFLDTD